MVGCFRRKGEADQDEFLKVVNIDGEKDFLNASFTNIPWGHKSPFRKVPPYQNHPSLEGVENLSLVCVCARERARARARGRVWQAPGRGRVENEGCGLDSAKEGDANISRIINVLVGRDQT